MVVPQPFPGLGNDGEQVVRRIMASAAQRWPKAAFVMPGASHHQGKLTLNKYMVRWVHELISLF